MKHLIKPARHLLGLSQVELSSKLSMSTTHLRRIEGKNSYTGLVSDENFDELITLLESLGIKFLNDGDISIGNGVSLKSKEK